MRSNGIIVPQLMTNVILDIGAVSAGGLLSLLEVRHGVLR
jgi:hypothetical protein